MSSLASDSYEDPIPAPSRSLIIKHPRAYFHPQGGYNNVRFDSTKCSEDVYVHGNHFWPDDLEQGEYACYTEGCVPYSAEESDVILAAEPIHPSIVYHGDGVTVPVLPKPAGRCLEVHESFMALVLSLCHIRYCVHSAGEQIVGIDVFPTGVAIARGVGTGLPAFSTVGQELVFDGHVFVSQLDLAWAHLALDGTYVVVHLNYCDSQAHCYLSPSNFLRLFCPWYSGGPLYHGKPNPCILYDSRPVFANANYCLIDERHDVVACADQSGPLPVVVALGGRYAHALPSSKIVWVALDSFPFYIAYPASFLYSRPRPSSFSKPLPQEIVDVITQMTCGPVDDCSFALSRLAIAHSMAACGCTYYNSCRRGEELPGSLSVDVDKFYTRNMEYKENKLGRHVHMFAHPKPVTGRTREWDFKLPQMTFREWNGIRPHVSEWAGRIWWMQENLGDNHYFTPIVIEFSVRVNSPTLVHGQKRWAPTEYSGNVAVAFPMQASSGNPTFDLEAMDWTDLRCTAAEVLHPHVLGRIPSRPATVYINSLYLHKRLVHREEWNGDFPEDCSTPQRQEIDWDVVSQLLDEFRTFAPCNVIDMLVLENWDVQKTREAIARTVAAEEAEASSEEEDDQ